MAISAFNSEVFDKRLERIENKLDGLSEAVINLARIDEKLTATIGELSMLRKQVTANDTRIGSIEKWCAATQPLLNSIDKLSAHTSKLDDSNTILIFKSKVIERIFFFFIGVLGTIVAALILRVI